MNMMTRPAYGLSDEQLRAKAPSIFATRPWDTMSARYRFVPTITVIDRMRAEGFYPVDVRQGRSRIEGKENYTRHMIRFRSQEAEMRRVGQEIPELVFVHSHDGTTGYILFAGVFRTLCLNGLIVQTASFGEIRARHTGAETLADELIDASFKMVGHIPTVMGQIETWRSVTLDWHQRRAFAEKALELRGTALQVQPDHLLGPRRADDTGTDLWSTLNVVQENLLRGGIEGRSANGRRRMNLRAVKAVAEDVRINRGLWTLAEEFALAA